MTGTVISNDGDIAIVLLENGDRVRFERGWTLKSKTPAQFAKDLPVGPLSKEISIERLPDRDN